MSYDDSNKKNKIKKDFQTQFSISTNLKFEQAFFIKNSADKIINIWYQLSSKECWY